MATIQILTREELEARDQAKKGNGKSGRRRSPERQAIIDQFKQSLQGAEPGAGGDVTLDEGEEKRVVRANLKEAAKELDLHLDFRPIKNPSLITFRIITAEEKAAQPKRGGRPRKVQPEAVQEIVEESVVEPAPPAPRSRRRRKDTEAA